MHGGQLDVAVINIQLNYVVVWLCFLEKRKICMVIKRNAETEFLSSLPASGLMRWRGGGGAGVKRPSDHSGGFSHSAVHIQSHYFCNLHEALSADTERCQTVLTASHSAPNSSVMSFCTCSIGNGVCLKMLSDVFGAKLSIKIQKWISKRCYLWFNFRLNYIL